MSKALPFQNTDVPAIKSIGQSIGLLVESGFEKVGQVITPEGTQVMAQYRSASFVWSPQVDLVYRALVNKRFSYDRDQMRAKAERMAWRLIFFEIKAATDSVKYQAASIAQVFGGRLCIADQAGKPRFYSEMITEAIEGGDLKKLPMLEMPKV